MKIEAKQIDAILPQTQCGQCGYEGCFPYAQAIAEKGETIDRCPPGGLKTLKALASLLGKSMQPFLEKVAIEEKPPKMAYIRESECIGCTKCIQACPVDAIIGAAKQLHTIIQQECTGCGLCVPPCPVDCIDMLLLNLPSYHPEQARKRFQAKKQRLEKEIIEKKQREQTQRITARFAYVTAATARAKVKKKIGFPNFLPDKNKEQTT